MACRDFGDDPPEEVVVSDIESEKDEFNDETFGVDVDKLECNEFDFSSTTCDGVIPTQLHFQNQNSSNKHVEKHGLRPPSSDDSDDSGDIQSPPQPFHQRNEGPPLNKFTHPPHGPIDRRINNNVAQAKPLYFRPEQDSSTRHHQPQQQLPQQQAYQVDMSSLSIRPPQEQHRPAEDFMIDHSEGQQQSQNQNVSFQPFSFTHNGYRRPQWDDEDMDQPNQHHQNRQFQYHNRNYNHGGGAQPQYFRNRQQGYQPNWQQRENFGHQRQGYYRNDDRDDRGGRWQHRGERQFERRGNHDSWAGLMTWREKLTVLRIQLLQIISDRGPNFDDYYARMLAEKRKEQSQRVANQPGFSDSSAAVTSAIQNRGANGNDSSDGEAGAQSGDRRHHSGDRDRRRRTVSASDGGEKNTNTRNRIPIPRLSVVDVQPYRPLAAHGTLGKWTTTTVTRPRQIIDCSAMQNLEDLQETGGRKGESTAKLLRQALGGVERLHDFVLIAEDIERLTKQGATSTSDVVPEGHVEGTLRIGSFQSTNMPKPVDPAELESQLAVTRRNIALTFCAPMRLALILAIKKGRRILPRAIRTLNRGKFYNDDFELSMHLASILCEHLPLLIRREPVAAALVAVVSPLCTFVKEVLRLKNSVPSTGNNDDFLFTVKAILADKALSIRSPELVTLLASVVNVRR